MFAVVVAIWTFSYKTLLAYFYGRLVKRLPLLNCCISSALILASAQAISWQLIPLLLFIRSLILLYLCQILLLGVHFSFCFTRGNLQPGNLANMSKLVDTSCDHCVIWCLIFQSGLFVVLRDRVAALRLTSSPAVSAYNCRQRLQDEGLNSYKNAWNLFPTVDKNASKFPV